MIEENQGLSGRLGSDEPTALAPLRGQAAARLEQSRSSTDAAPSSRVPTFTPQPWDWEGTPQFAGGAFHCYLTDANGRKIGTLWGPSTEKIANARLITRAPRLYEALDLLVDAYWHGELEDADFAAAEALLGEIVAEQGQ